LAFSCDVGEARRSGTIYMVEMALLEIARRE
jgi:hypothetical protein